ncbi:hypothetical protein GCM10009413_17280 [Tatumella punctata]
MILTEKNVFKLVHSGVSKQQRRIIIWYEGAAGYNLVSLALKEIEKRLTDLSSTLAHKYPGITLTDVPFVRAASTLRPAGDSGTKKWE